MKRKTIVILLACLFITCLFKYRQYLLRKAPEVYHYNQESIVTKYTYFDGLKYILIDNKRVIEYDNLIVNTNSFPSEEFKFIDNSIVLVNGNEIVKRYEDVMVDDKTVIELSSGIFLQDNNFKSGFYKGRLDLYYCSGGLYSLNGAMIGSDEYYYLDDVFCRVSWYGIDYYILKKQAVEDHKHIDIPNDNHHGNSFGISRYQNNNYYYISRLGEKLSPPNEIDFRAILNRKHSDILYKYNSITDEMEEVYITDNIIIRYIDKEIYMLTRNFELLHYSFETQETISLGKINKTCDEVHNCKDLIVFYKGNHLLKIFDTKKNAFVEVPN
ncbi:MAG: hypothetical protein J6D29_06565 [Solobacterium sp.]|nr:hypothetical protein [Solobacterium sp.]